MKKKEIIVRVGVALGVIVVSDLIHNRMMAKDLNAEANRIYSDLTPEEQEEAERLYQKNLDTNVLLSCWDKAAMRRDSYANIRSLRNEEETA